MAELLPLRAAVEQLVRDGDTVALEGFTHLIPHAAGHELIRQHRRDLTLIRMTPDVIYDKLIGMGCARKLVFSWAWQSTPERESQVTIDLNPVTEGTMLTLTHEQFYDQKACDDHRVGWERAFDNLEKMLA